MKLSTAHLTVIAAFAYVNITYKGANQYWAKKFL